MNPTTAPTLANWLTDSRTSWRIPAFLGAFLALLSFWALRGAFTKGDFGVVVATAGLFALGFTFSAKRQRLSHQSLLISALFFLIIHPAFSPGIGFGTLLLYVAILQILQGTDAERTVRNFLTIACIASIYTIRLVRVGMVDFTWVEGGISLSLVLLTLWMIAARSHAWQTERSALIQNLETTAEALAEPQAQAFKATSRLTDLGLLHRCSATTMTAANRTDVYTLLHERFAAGSMTWMQVQDAWIPTESLEAFTDILARTCDPMELQWEVETTREEDAGALHLRFEISYWEDTLKQAVYSSPHAELNPELEDVAWWKQLLGQALHRMVDQGWETRVMGQVLKLTYRFELTSDNASSGPAQGSTRHLYTPEFARKFPMRILVAEDNPVNQKLVVFMLEKLGYSLTMAQDGQKAIDLAAEQAFDLIFMDLHMPHVDGVEAAKRILASGQSPTIVPLTANVSDTSRQACAEAGMTGFIAKPFAIGELCEAIKAAHQAG